MKLKRLFTDPEFEVLLSIILWVVIIGVLVTVGVSLESIHAVFKKWFEFIRITTYSF